jgi:dihydroorotate dehydrogenase
VTDVDLAADVGGLRLPFVAMNAANAATTARDLHAVATSDAGAVVLRTATAHPFVHPEFRSLHNPGFDKLVGLARELVAVGKPVVASVCGGTVRELAHLGNAFGESGVAAVEANLAEDWVAATLAPFDDLRELGTLCTALVGATAVPVWLRFPNRPLPYREVLAVVADAGVRAVVVRNEFTEFEKLLLELTVPVDVVTTGNVQSGYDVRRALAKGARAVQVGPTLGREGAGVFARLAREMRRARSSPA